MSKKIEIPKLADDVAVQSAQKLLAEIQAKFEKAANYPLIDDFAERAKAMLDGTKLQPRKEPDEIELLRAAARMALERLQEAQTAAATKIIAEITPQYLKVREALLEQAIAFKLSLQIHEDYIQSLWAAGLGNFLSASWSSKVSVVQIYPHGRLDNLIENLKIAT